MQLLQQGDMSMKGNMCKTITHMFSMVHSFTCVYAMCVNKHCSTHEILCYKRDPGFHRGSSIEYSSGVAGLRPGSSVCSLS